MARIIDGNEMNMVGDRVRQLRIAKGMSQQTLSNKLEMLASIFAAALSPALKIRRER